MKAPILAVLAELRARAPEIAALTLSSTHLSRFASEFARFAPDLRPFGSTPTLAEL